MNTTTTPCRFGPSHNLGCADDCHGRTVTRYAVLVDGTAHVVTDLIASPYARRGAPADAAATPCGYGPGEEAGYLLLTPAELTTDRPSAEEWDLCSRCFAA